MTNPPISIPVPLPEAPEKSASLTAMLQHMEALGLVTVAPAMIVTTPNAQVASLLRGLITPPKPAKAPPEGDEKPKRNVYHDPETGEDIHAVAMAARLKKEHYNVGKRFSSRGKGLVEVAFNRDSNSYFLQRVQQNSTP